MTLANWITIARLFLLPIFLLTITRYVDTGVVAWRYWALGIFAVASLSDGIDGYVARKYKQQSDLGAFLDPLADKLLLVSTLVFLSFDHQPYFDQIPLYLTITVFGREVLLLIGVTLLKRNRSRLRVRPSIPGKAATVFLMATIIWTLVSFPSFFVHYLAFVSAVLTAVSFAIYARDGINLSKTKISDEKPGSQ